MAILKISVDRFLYYPPCDHLCKVEKKEIEKEGGGAGKSCTVIPADMLVLERTMWNEVFDSFP